MGDVIAFPGGWHSQDEPGTAQRRPVTQGTLEPHSVEQSSTDRSAPTPGPAPLRPVPSDQRTRPHRELLWREAAGHELRQERLRQARTQTDVADRAGVSTQYLSEIERGRKEPSSEVLHAVTGALGLNLLDLTRRVSRTLTATSAGRSPSTSPVLRAA